MMLGKYRVAVPEDGQCTRIWENRAVRSSSPEAGTIQFKKGSVEKKLPSPGPSPKAGTIQKGTRGNRENRGVSNSFV
jgi:hypothetical protein